MLANRSSKRFLRPGASSGASSGQSPDCRIRASKWARFSGTRRPTYQMRVGGLVGRRCRPPYFARALGFALGHRVGEPPDWAVAAQVAFDQESSMSSADARAPGLLGRSGRGECRRRRWGRASAGGLSEKFSEVAELGQKLARGSSATRWVFLLNRSLPHAARVADCLVLIAYGFRSNSKGEPETRDARFSSNVADWRIYKTNDCNDNENS
jgi:hypothetical protein